MIYPGLAAAKYVKSNLNTLLPTRNVTLEPTRNVIHLQYKEPTRNVIADYHDDIKYFMLKLRLPTYFYRTHSIYCISHIFKFPNRLQKSLLAIYYSVNQFQ